ncbi:MAG: glycosyltransferase family 4 protein [Candidatus Moranbacteria bacterium]|nr:glycosyltransferase family 4 protein [Candidatus Moranbacteria bacterium]
MRIGIDARTILSPEKSDSIGSGHYTYQLVRHILDLDKTNEYVLFFDHRVRDKDARKFKRNNVKVVFYPFSDYKKYLPGAYSEVLGLATLQKENLDLLHVTSPDSRIPVGYHGKKIVTFSDLSFFGIPNCYPSMKREFAKIGSRYMAQRADKIIAISNSVKDELQGFLNVSPEKIDVIYGGFDERFLDSSDAKKERVLGKYGVRGKYILFLGTIEPSKNVTRLIQAFAKFKKSFLKKNGKKKNFEYQLILAGKKGWLADEYIQIARDFDVIDDIILTGYVIGDELSVLFRNADFFVAPFLYGSFGGGVLEAFATKTPAIVSRIPSFVEIADDAVIFIDPLDTDGLSDAMLQLCCDSKKKKELSEKGFSQIERFNWKKAAKETIELYERMV